MKHKIFFSLLLPLIFIFSVNLAFAQTCSDPTDPVSETGRCLSACDPATEHQISGACIGQVCCAANSAGGSSTAPASGACQSQGSLCGGNYGNCCSPFACYQDPQTTTGVNSSTCQMSGYSGGSGTSVPYSGFPAASSGAAAGGWSLGSINTFGLPGGSVMGIAVNILSWLLWLFGIIGILGFIISGIIYLTAAGDEDRMGYAKRAMQYSILGVIIGLSGFVIIQAVDYALNAYSSF